MSWNFCSNLRTFFIQWVKWWWNGAISKRHFVIDILASNSARVLCKGINHRRWQICDLDFDQTQFLWSCSKMSKTGPTIFCKGEGGGRCGFHYCVSDKLFPLAHLSCSRCFFFKFVILTIKAINIPKIIITKVIIIINLTTMVDTVATARLLVTQILFADGLIAIDHQYELSIVSSLPSPPSPPLPPSSSSSS